jgi:hypothetical protein
VSSFPGENHTSGVWTWALWRLRRHCPRSNMCQEQGIPDGHPTACCGRLEGSNGKNWLLCCTARIFARSSPFLTIPQAASRGSRVYRIANFVIASAYRMAMCEQSAKAERLDRCPCDSALVTNRDVMIEQEQGVQAHSLT